MNTSDVISQIESLVKPYNHIGMKQGTYSRTMRDIKHGHAKDSTVKAFFGKFGFIQEEIQWKKK